MNKTYNEVQTQSHNKNPVKNKFFLTCSILQNMLECAFAENMWTLTVQNTKVMPILFPQTQKPLFYQRKCFSQFNQ